MSNKIYTNGSFIIFRSGKGYVVYNRAKRFEEGHTHLNNFNAGKKAISLVKRGKIPLRSSNYYLESLARLTSDRNYAKELRKIIKDREISYKNRATKEK